MSNLRGKFEIQLIMKHHFQSWLEERCEAEIYITKMLFTHQQLSMATSTHRSFFLCFVHIWFQFQLHNGSCRDKINSPELWWWHWRRRMFQQFYVAVNRFIESISWYSEMKNKDELVTYSSREHTFENSTWMPSLWNDINIERKISGIIFNFLKGRWAWKPAHKFSIFTWKHRNTLQTQLQHVNREFPVSSSLSEVSLLGCFPISICFSPSLHHLQHKNCMKLNCSQIP